MARVIITMPAYRAEATLERTVADIPEGIADELILVDDASPDNTAELARSLGISVYVHPQNRGYGGNQKTCYTMALQSGADIVVMLHPDYQYEPKSVPLLIAPIVAGDADMTFGSRFAGLGDPRTGGMPMYRFVGNRLTTTLENLLLGSRFSEMHSGMRAYTRRCLLSLPFLSYSEDFGFDSQFLVDAVTSGQRVVEVPIPTRYTKESSSIGIARSLKYVAQSILYAGKQALSRGRRGRRYPVTLTSPRARAMPAGSDVGTLARAQLDQPPPGLPLDQLVDKLQSYYSAGRRVAVFDADADLVRGRSPALGEYIDVSEEPDGSWDGFEIAVFKDALEIMKDPVATIRHALSGMHEEGLAVMFLGGGDRKARGPGHRAARIVHRLFHETGLRMVEWDPATRPSSGRPTIVLARRSAAG